MAIFASLDKAPNDQVEITIQLLNPSITARRNQGSMQKVTQSISAKGKTIFDANLDPLHNNFGIIYEL